MLVAASSAVLPLPGDPKATPLRARAPRGVVPCRAAGDAADAFETTVNSIAPVTTANLGKWNPGLEI